MSIRDDLKKIDTHKVGEYKANLVGKALKAAIKECPEGLFMSDKGLSAIVYGASIEGAAIRVYLDSAKTDVHALVIVNPPIMAAGDENPMQAIIEVICLHGGSPSNPLRVIPARKQVHRG